LIYIGRLSVLGIMC